MWAKTRAANLILLSAWILVALPGCTTNNQERLQLLNEDGVHLFQQGDYRSARQSFEAALRVKPNDGHLLFNIGQCYDRLGSTQKAESYYQQCLEVSPNHAPCRRALAVLWLKDGKRKEVEQFTEDWLAREPKLADAYVEDGWRLRMDHDLFKAQARFQQALDIDAHNARGLYEMGVLFELLSEPGRALALYERSLQIDPQQPETSNRVNTLRAKGVTRPLPD
jgi:tetratricopeptide (TPR) repeat protein